MPYHFIHHVVGDTKQLPFKLYLSIILKHLYHGAVDNAVSVFDAYDIVAMKLNGHDELQVVDGSTDGIGDFAAAQALIVIVNAEAGRFKYRLTRFFTINHLF